jgi:hypothetical protein
MENGDEMLKNNWINEAAMAIANCDNIAYKDGRIISIYVMNYGVLLGMYCQDVEEVL